MGDGTNRGTRKIVKGPDGTPLSVNDLPPASETRWTVKRKAVVVACVRGGLIGLNEMQERYGLSLEEFLEWERDLQDGGLNGLKVTKLQERRRGRRGESADGVDGMIG